MTYRVGCGKPRYQQTSGRRPLGIIGELRRIRVEKGICQEILAEKIGLERNRISTWECGRNQPGLLNVQDWANALGYELTLTAK